jgi:hypothetical protein
MKLEQLVIAGHYTAVNKYGFAYRLPVKRLELIIVELSGILNGLFKILNIKKDYFIFS